MADSDVKIFTEQYYSQIVAGLRANTIRRIDLSNSVFGDRFGEEGDVVLFHQRRLIEALAENTSLEYLDVSGYKKAHSDAENAPYDGRLIQQLCVKIKQHPALKTVILSSRKIDTVSASSIGALLKENDVLRRLTLKGCHLEHRAFPSLVEGLCENAQLRHLELDGNRLGRESIEILGKFLEKDRLVYLGMSGGDALRPFLDPLKNLIDCSENIFPKKRQLTANKFKIYEFVKAIKGGQPYDAGALKEYFFAVEFILETKHEYNRAQIEAIANDMMQQPQGSFKVKVALPLGGGRGIGT